MSRTIKFARAGGPDVLEYVESVDPEPGAHEVRIRVAAIGINRAESMWRSDAYIEPVKFPAGLGYEAAGVVDAIGDGVIGVAIGDAVNVIPCFSMNQYTTYGEVIVAPDYAVVPQPRSLSFAEGASIWMMFMTAYGALIEDAKIGPGDYVLVPAASSSVGLAAIQLANYVDATPIALTCTSQKRTRLLEAGARHVVATDEVDLVPEVMRITGGTGARIAFDPIGGPNFPKLISALAFQGTVYLYGALGEGVTPLPVLDMIGRMPTVKGHNIWQTSGDDARRKAAVAFIVGALEAVLHHLQRGLRHDEGAADIDVDDAIHLFERRLLERLGDRGARVADQHVETTERGHGLRDGRIVERDQHRRVTSERARSASDRR